MSADTPRILVFGDSHVHAIQRALTRGLAELTGVPVEARRLLKVKGQGGQASYRPRRPRGFWARLIGKAPAADDIVLDDLPPGVKVLGDTDFDAMLAMARKLRSRDLLVSVMGGNKHAVFSTIQHPRPFDFLLPGDDSAVDEGAEIIPFRQLEAFLMRTLKRGDGALLEALKKNCRGRMVHLAAPPPKRDDDFIRQYHDTQFAADGIGTLGVSKPTLRLKFWKLQDRAVREICDDLEINYLPPPAGAVDEDGFLARDCYAHDATHANEQYGRLVIEQVRAFAGAQP